MFPPFEQKAWAKGFPAGSNRAEKAGPPLAKKTRGSNFLRRRGGGIVVTGKKNIFLNQGGGRVAPHF